VLKSLIRWLSTILLTVAWGIYFVFVSSGLFVGALEQLPAGRLGWLFEATHNSIARAALYSPFVGGIYQTFGFHQELRKPPPLLYLSDGGHLENLGLKQLLFRRCKEIIVCDAGEDPRYRCKELSAVLKDTNVVHDVLSYYTSSEIGDEDAALDHEEKEHEKGMGSGAHIEMRGLTPMRTASWLVNLRRDIKRKQVVSLEIEYPEHPESTVKTAWIHYLKASPFLDGQADKVGTGHQYKKHSVLKPSSILFLG